VTIVGRGKCNIVIKTSETKEYKETEEKVTIKIDKGYQKIKVQDTSYKKYVSDKNFKLEAYVEATGDGKEEYIANENDVVKVSKDGEVTILGPETARLYAVSTGKNNINRDISYAIVITVEEAKKSDPDIKHNVENTTTAMQNTT
ncbi:serine protease, partial [Anaerostipes hadrus]|nr:serine protease [Anaerostipes hadrus]